MAKFISLILTNETDIKVPKEIPHLIKHGILIIPIEEYQELSFFIDDVLETGNNKIADYSEYYPFIKLIENLKINKFMAFLEDKTEYYEFVAENGFVILETIQTKPNYDINKPSAFKHIGFENINIGDYHSYYSIKHLYNEELNTDEADEFGDRIIRDTTKNNLSKPSRDEKNKSFWDKIKEIFSNN